MKTKEAAVPEGDDTFYSFSGSGHLIYKNHQFFRSFSRGQDFITVYKCLEFKKKKCPVIIKTQGKKLASVDGRHNHD